MGIFSRRQQPPPLPPAAPAPQIDLASLLQIAVVDGVKAALEVANASHQLAMDTLKVGQDIREKQHRRLGGKIRAKTGKRVGGRFISNCRLCKNPMIGDPSIDEIVKHSSHGAAEAEALRELPPPRRERDAVRDPIPVEIQTDPRTGDEVIECESCGTPHAQGEHVN
jgi:hypothetical protein